MLRAKRAGLRLAVKRIMIRGFRVTRAGVPAHLLLIILSEVTYESSKPGD
jgi:hypothetical protein